MEKKTTRETSFPLQAEVLDVTAVTYLQSKRKLLRLNFSLEAVEHALDKVLQANRRKAVEEQLGKDLYRDGKRYAKRLNKFVELNDEFSSEIAENTTEVSSAHTSAFYQNTCTTISYFFGALSAQERTVLKIALAGQKSNEPYILEALGLGVRQFRNILVRIQRRIRSNSIISSAFDTAIDYWGFTIADFEKLIGGSDE